MEMVMNAIHGRKSCVNIVFFVTSKVLAMWGFIC